MLMIVFTFSGCYTYFAVDADEFKEIEESDKISIVLNTEEKVFLDSIKTVVFDEYNRLEITQNDSTQYTYSLNDIKEFRIEKHDYGKLVGLVIFGGIGLFLILAGIMYLMYPDGISFG